MLAVIKHYWLLRLGDQFSYDTCNCLTLNKAISCCHCWSADSVPLDCFSQDNNYPGSATCSYLVKTSSLELINWIDGPRCSNWDQTMFGRTRVCIMSAVCNYFTWAHPPPLPSKRSAIAWLSCIIHFEIFIK